MIGIVIFLGFCGMMPSRSALIPGNIVGKVNEDMRVY